jgi:hypothetical protein
MGEGKSDRRLKEINNEVLDSFLLVTKHYLGEQIKDNELSEEKCIQGVGRET